MADQENGYALITGASSGIGYEFAKLLAKDGNNLVLIARREDKLNEVKKEIQDNYQVKIKILSKDLSKPESPLEIFSELENKNIIVDKLINNAGFGIYGKFSETDLDKELKMIQLHITSVTHLTKLFLRKMLERKKGKILNVASAAAFQPGPLHSIYFATKAYILYFSEALANELKGTGVSVTCLCPGPTETPFFDNSTVKRYKLTKLNMMDVDKVTKAGYAGFKKGKTVVIPGLKNKLIIFLIRFLPRNIVTKIARSAVEFLHKGE